MPELPEVDTIRSSLNNLIAGQELVKIERLTPYCIDDPTGFFSAQNLANGHYQITAFRRHGKFLLCYLKVNGQIKPAASYLVLIFHMRMTGRLVYSSDLQAWPKHTHFVLHLKKQAQEAAYVNFHDVRRFGGVKVIALKDLAQERSLLNLAFDAWTLEKGLKEQLAACEPGEKEAVLRNFASAEADCLSEAAALERFVRTFKQKAKRNIKTCLLDQSLIAGLGNIYADELLFAAQIHPERLLADISEAELRQLFALIKPLLAKSISLGGTSFSDYVDGLGRKGNFAKELKVFKQAKQPCANCARPLSKSRIAGRGTHFCTHCQK